MNQTNATTRQPQYNHYQTDADFKTPYREVASHTNASSTTPLSYNGGRSARVLSYPFPPRLIRIQQTLPAPHHSAPHRNPDNLTRRNLVPLNRRGEIARSLPKEQAAGSSNYLKNFNQTFEKQGPQFKALPNPKDDLQAFKDYNIKLRTNLSRSSLSDKPPIYDKKAIPCKYQNECTRASCRFGHQWIVIRTAEMLKGGLLPEKALEQLASECALKVLSNES
jgi:hypothetical protein